MDSSFIDSIASSLDSDIFFISLKRVNLGYFMYFSIF